MKILLYTLALLVVANAIGALVLYLATKNRGPR